MEIRPAEPEDADAIGAVHRAAFPEPAEAELVATIVREGEAAVSLVAVEEGALVGHVLLSRMRVKGDGRAYRAVALGPIAVLPERQGQGLGSALIESALSVARTTGEYLVFVIGEPAYLWPLRLRRGHGSAVRIRLFRAALHGAGDAERARAPQERPRRLRPRLRRSSLAGVDLNLGIGAGQRRRIVADVHPGDRAAAAQHHARLQRPAARRSRIPIDWLVPSGWRTTIPLKRIAASSTQNISSRTRSVLETAMLAWLPAGVACDCPIIPQPVCAAAGAATTSAPAASRAVRAWIMPISPKAGRACPSPLGPGRYHSLPKRRNGGGRADRARRL